MTDNSEDISEHCSCNHLVDLTSCGNIDELNDNFKKVLADFSQCEAVSIIEDSDTETPQTQKLTHIVKLKNGSSIKFGMFNPKTKPADDTLKELNEVYINMYHSLELSITDKLTGLYNRQHLNHKMERILLGENIEARKKSRERVLLIFDIDHFKNVNDTFGHVYGDEVILRVAQIAKEKFRTEDWIFRYGGEEFLVIIQDIELNEAMGVIERFRESIEKLVFPTVGQITISLGYCQMDYSELATSNIERADKALYYAKENGRNQSQCYESLVASGEIKTAAPIEDDIELF